MTTLPALDIHDLHFRYAGMPSTEPVVDIQSLKLDRTDQMLLKGRSGSGKSTLLYLIAGLMEPQGGQVLINGENIHELQGEKRDLFRGRTIGMIFQTFNLLQGFTALENVLAALMFSELPPKHHRERATALLDSLGIDRPNQFVERLSIGQQQRVAVARAVACEPALVLADEPTASLDPENADAAMDLIQKACLETGAALLCTSHDPSLASRFERCVDLSQLRVEPELDTKTLEMSTDRARRGGETTID
ncbi:MAG: ABC transporter ATP-binding protein [Phycisphaerales bacterium]|nr:MAG: ABC transporter ATP-binding protein [Phycisphaerales bacterium]